MKLISDETYDFIVEQMQKLKDGAWDYILKNNVDRDFLIYHGLLCYYLGELKNCNIEEEFSNEM